MEEKEGAKGSALSLPFFSSSAGRQNKIHNTSQIN